MTVALCAHVVATESTYDPAACAYTHAPVRCDAVAVRIWTDGVGQPRPVCLLHAKGHDHAPLCYAGDDADG